MLNGVTARYFLIAFGGLILGWALRHYRPWRPSSDTTRFFRQSGSNLKFYTTPTLIGTLLVSLAVLGVTRSRLAEWDAIEEKGGTIRPRQVDLFKTDVMIAALTTWYAFINPAWQRAREKQKEASNGNTKPPLG
jgi:hypothetical protein